MRSYTAQNILLVLAFIVGVGLFEYFEQRGAFVRVGVAALGFFSPFFIYKCYLLFWVKRDNLKFHYENAKTSFSVIKSQREEKKK